ncbi:M56 family metallopeptidase [Gimesia fumaroli]|uniref:Regulatory protein BlaR1 n=1 Tax=Gimesia fumaroli TaxID=2527976 RepID=A0A518IJN7_9PLAN|nr:M56 family metallopeptidase [Gimesia fumaroli]QDV53307.1 Regulatory protein BlaR1 [Gimesia fumaroli]
MNGFLLTANVYVELTDKILELLIIPTITAGLLAGLVLLVNLFARKWLTAGQMGLLWALVLIRLAIPYGAAPESSFSLTNLVFGFIEEATADESPRDGYEAYALQPLPEPWPVPDATPALANTTQMNQFQFHEPRPPEVSFTKTFFEYFVTFLEWFFRILPPLWFAGALFLLIQTLISHGRFTQKIQQLPACTNQRLLQLWNTCCEKVSFRRSVPLILCDDIAQPSVMGARTPRLLLPTDLTELSDQQLTLIMLHELAHLKQRDLWVNWCLFGLRLLHWWNPLYWLASTRYQSLREQSRDAMVLRWREQQSPDSAECNPSREFSELLLILAQRDPGAHWRVSLPVSLLGFLKFPFRKRSLANRLKALRTATVKVHPLHTTAVILVIALFAATGLADVKDPPPQPQNPAEHDRRLNLYANLDLPEVFNTTDSEPLQLRTIQVENVVRKISDHHGISEAEAQKYLLIHVDFLLGIHNRTYTYFGKPLKQASAKYDQQNRLVVHAPNSLHGELHQQLRAWEQSGPKQISIEVRFAELSTDVLAKSHITWDALEADVAPPLESDFETLSNSREPVVKSSAIIEEYFPVRVTTLTPAQEAQFIQAAQSDSRSNIMFAPKVTLFNGQRATISDLVSRPFVIGLKKQEGEQLQPRIKAIDEGRNLTLRTVVSASGDEVNLKGLFELSQIVDVNLFTTPVAGKDAVIQIPRVHRQRISVASQLKDQQCLLICIPPTFQQKQFQYVILRVQILDEPKQESSPEVPFDE